ncbi:MAG: DUF4252 domain-containing protein [Acidobacteriia bacterium]|nr:DUF4252 domain-containing protein [Terriglobia bacterium]
MRRIFLITVIAGWTAAQLPAQLLQLRITGLDGLASKAKESVDITLDSSLLQMAGGFLARNGKGSKDSQDITSLLTALKAITVRSFEFNETGQYRIEDLEPIRAQLRTPGWSKIISTQKQGEISEIYTRMEQGKVVGFAIIAAEPKELTIVAIEGTIDLKDLSKLGGLGVPSIPIPDQGKKGKQE